MMTNFFQKKRRNGECKIRSTQDSYAAADGGCHNKNNNPEEKQILYFQDFFHHHIGTHSNIKHEENEPKGKSQMDTAEIFFELANAPIIGYKISRDIIHSSSDDIDNQRKKRKLNQEMKKIKKHKDDNDDVNDNDNSDEDYLTVLIRQDNSCKTHTGGIVWETSYLLATYLLACTNQNNDNYRNNHQLGKTLEVGSGCGLLGLILASSGLCTKVVMTETKEVMLNLLQNVEYNHNNNNNNNNLSLPTASVSVRQLRWDVYKDDIKYCQRDLNSDDLNPHTCDTIVGTDVIFSPCLVKPLLKTLRKMSHDATNIYLCVQIRCEDSHSLFVKKAIKYDLRCEDITEKLKDFPSCLFGLELDCKLLHLTLSKGANNKKRKKM